MIFSGNDDDATESLLPSSSFIKKGWPDDDDSVGANKKWFPLADCAIHGHQFAAQPMNGEISIRGWLV